MKIVINKNPGPELGRFGLSAPAIKKYLELNDKECFCYDVQNFMFDSDHMKKVKNPKKYDIFFVYTKDFGDSFISSKESERYFFDIDSIKRTDEALIKVVEELKGRANGPYAKLKVIEIPDDIEYEIDNEDGYETIHEKHRSW